MIAEQEISGVFTPEKKDIWELGEKSYRCDILICPEEEGGYSAVVLNLPGVASCGDTSSEAYASAREAIAAALEEYEASGMAIPWANEYKLDVPFGGVLKRIHVNA